MFKNCMLFLLLCMINATGLAINNIIDELQDIILKAKLQNGLSEKICFDALTNTLLKLETLTTDMKGNIIKIADDLLEIKSGELYAEAREEEAEQCLRCYLNAPKNGPSREDRERCEELNSKVLNALKILKENELYNNEFVPSIKEWQYVNTLIDIFEKTKYHVSESHMSLAQAMDKAIKKRKISHQGSSVLCSCYQRGYLLSSVNPTESIKRAKRDSYKIVKIFYQYDIEQQLQNFLETNY